jgi:hypothetical protein
MGKENIPELWWIFSEFDKSVDEMEICICGRKKFVDNYSCPAEDLMASSYKLIPLSEYFS